jgi:hypothetical protein
VAVVHDRGMTILAAGGWCAALLVLGPLTAAACAGGAAGAAGSGGAAAPAAATTAAAGAGACTASEHRQLDFWLGEWDVVVRARKAPDSSEWGEARGSQRIESALGGCVVAEHFAADGPGPAWAGASYSMWQPASRTWRQTWVDDQGSYLLFTGGLEAGVMTLYGEPRQVKGKRVRMRMIFLEVAADSMRWEWQREAEGVPGWTAMMVIEYRRRPTS